MGLYLCVFVDEATDDEIEGVEVGSYDDFHRLRSTVAEVLEDGKWGSRFPILMLHPDADGVWTPAEARALEAELLQIGDELARHESPGFPPGWPAEVARSLGLSARNLCATFIDVDGEPLVDRLVELARVAWREGREIWFQ